MAQKFVREKLKSPSTAKFPEDPKVTQTEMCKYDAVGSVDATNAFGGVVRTNFFASVGYVGDDKWRSLSIKIIE
jgi:hypothetical protein